MPIKRDSKLTKISSQVDWVLIAKLFKGIKLLVVLLIYGYLMTMFYNYYIADVNYQKSTRYIIAGEMSKALDAANKSIELNPLEPNYHRMHARVLINFLPKQPPEVQKQLKKIVLHDLETAYGLNPKNLVTIRNLVPLYYFVAAENILIGATPENVDEEFLPYARDFYNLHKHYSPNDVGVYALIAKYEKRLNLVKEYGDSVKRVAVLRRDLLDWYEAFK
jgi:hypothetical protein